MSSIDYYELFEHYYQNEYDFNTHSLSDDEVRDIKRLVKEKRVDYARAPMGTGVFEWILKQNCNIRFEPVKFDADRIDGMLYIPSTGKEKAYIILNTNKPLANQIFAAAHEFYHYIRDYQTFREKPYICDFSMLKNVNEKKACRFAAELLLPEEALSQEIDDYCRMVGVKNIKSADFVVIAVIILILTVKYQIPLKAVIYRLKEERYIDNISKYIENYSFIKSILQEIKKSEKRVNELYSTENDYITPYSFIYQDIETAYVSGYASRENILEDASKLQLDMDMIYDILNSDEAENIDSEEDDEELFSEINAKWGD